MADYTSWATFGGKCNSPSAVVLLSWPPTGHCGQKTLSDMHINISLECQQCQTELLRGALMLPVVHLGHSGSGATVVRVNNKSVASLLNYQPLISHI